LYGHGKENIPLAVTADRLAAVLRHGSRLVSLSGAVNESAFIRELQWDTYGQEVLHVDFARIAMHEKLRINVAVELRGEAPGVREGGVLNHLVHEVEIECPAGSIPEKVLVSVNNLKVGESLTVADLELPEGARCLEPPDTIVVQCLLPVEAPEEELVAAEAGPTEPEVISAKKQKEEEEEER
jgi:large subunit ribosomal protein L25